MEIIKIFLTLIVYIFTVDMLWLGFIANSIYDNEIGLLLKKSGGNMSPNWAAAAVVYIAIAAGIMCFVLPKSQDNMYQAMIWGAVFGAVTYGIYDFTNLSVLANWSIKITLIDVAWGTVLCSSGSVIAVMMANWLHS